MNITGQTITQWLIDNPLLGITLIVWTFLWKGVALWKAAGLRQKYWFVAILILNTIGILEIIYIFFVARKYEVEVIEK
ncbi:MAG: DUF5652 family protein [bacterium]|nr:DUF5652 family protein [bacterium]